MRPPEPRVTGEGGNSAGCGQEDKPQSHEQSEKFHVRRVIHRSSVSQIIHKVLRLKCYKKRLAQQLTEAHNMHALCSACSLRDDNVITNKPT